MLQLFGHVFFDALQRHMAGTFDHDLDKDKYVSELSGGQLQRVYIAMCLAQSTDIIFRQPFIFDYFTSFNTFFGFSSADSAFLSSVAAGLVEAG